MKKVLFIVGAVFLNGFSGSLAHAAFSLVTQRTITASAQVLGTGTGALTVTADPLPAQAFYGKNVVIPMTVSSDPSPLDTKNLKVELDYQLLDVKGNPIGGVSISTVTLVVNPKTPNSLKGAAILSRDNLVQIQHGGTLQYFFRAIQSSGDTVLQRTGILHVAPSAGLAAANAPFQVGIIDTWTSALAATGGNVSVPDTYVNDGQTSVALLPGAISAAGTLIIKAEDPAIYPSGPKGMRPVLVYSVNLQGAQLQREATITLSYPSEVDGTVTGLGVRPTALAPFWFDGSSWSLVSRPTLDTTLHTVTATSTRLATFALFAPGPITAKDERPNERIITPNGDGINDVANFANAVGEDIHFFDIRGRRIRTLRGPQSSWDGKDDSGKIVESGVYIYQYVSQGTRISGVIYVAK